MFFLAESSKIDLSCERWNNKHRRTIEEREREWNQFFDVFEHNLLEAEVNVINAWDTQAKDIDIPRLLRENYHAGYSSLADRIKDFLADKYYWRDWLIAVYAKAARIAAWFR